MQNGSLAVSGGRDIAPVINSLLALPFVVRIATRDWHPANHISFAANHGPSAHPFTSTTTVVNPYNAEERYETRLWPVHCVQGTTGAELVRELDTAHINIVVDKGTDPRVEMYSAFHDPFTSPRVVQSNLASSLRDFSVTHVYVVGLAADYCVRHTAVDSRAEGFETVIIEDATRAVDPEAWPRVREELRELGVGTVAFDSDEVRRVRLRGEESG